MPHDFATKLSAEEIAALERAMTGRAAAAPQSLADLPASFSSGARSYVVYTNINCEERAALGLRAAGFEVFLPTVTRMVKRGSRKKIKVERPLFSRYLFVRFDINRDPWTAIKRTDGVEALICNNQIPVSVPDAAIERLRTLQGLGAFDETVGRTEIGKGQSVRIEAGAFADWVGEVLAADNERRRVEILLDLLNRRVRINLPMESVRAVDR